jgi:GTPase KRas
MWARELTRRQLCLNHFVETYDPTIEDSYRKQVVIDSQSCMLEVLDTAGQEEYTALRDQWIRDGEGFVLVYSITSRSSFTRIHKFYNQIQRVKDSANAGSPTSTSYLASPIVSSAGNYTGPAPVMLVGNKSDRVTEREVSTQEGNALAKELGCDFVEASAKNCINVEKAFYDVVRNLKRQRQELGRMEKRATTLGAVGPLGSPVVGGVRGGRVKRIGREHSKCVIL